MTSTVNLNGTRGYNNKEDTMQEAKIKENQHDNGLEKTSVVIHALSMSIGTFTSRVLGLVRDQLFAAMFPVTVRDAWTAAFRIPNMFRRILGEGALSVSFIPVFVETRVQDGSGERSRNLVNSLYTILLLILTVITATGILFPEHYMSWLLDAEYLKVPGKFEMTVRMTRIMFLFLYFISTYAFFMGILNAFGKFALAAMAPTLFNIAMIVSTLVPQDWLSSRGDAIAWGVTIGGFLQMIILVPSLKRLGFMPQLRWSLSNSDMLKVLRNMGPGLLGLGVLQVTTIVNLKFASSLGEGPVSYIYLADRLLELPLSLVSVSIGTALLPSLAKMWSEGNRSYMIETSNYYLRLNLFVVVPAAIGLYALANPITEILFQHGKFNANDTAITASVVEVWSLMMIANSLVRVLVPAFYAIKNTWLPAAVGGICVMAHIFIAPILMQEWGLRGLNFSTVISGTLNFLLLTLAFRILIGPPKYLKLLGSSFKFLIGGGVMAFFCEMYRPLLNFLMETLGWNYWLLSVITLVLTISVSGGVYVALMFVMRSEELRQTWGTIRPKLQKRLKTFRS